MDLAEFFDESEVEAVRVCFGPAALPKLVVERVLELRIERRVWIEREWLRQSEFYKDGKRHGENVGHYENGKIMYRHHFVRGKWHGENVGWHKNGKLWYMKNFVRGIKHGKHEEWFENGQTMVEEYYRNGKKHGKSIHWLDCGKRLHVFEYKNGAPVRTTV